MVTLKIKHVDGRTLVIAKGSIKDGIFIGEYVFDGMTYGINIPIKQRYICGYCGNEVDEGGRPIEADDYPINAKRVEGSCCIMNERLGSF
jgi:hypothetical protein